MPFYQETRTMKGAVIGTIMPWSGPISGIPKGWIICDGNQPSANEYPLLVQAIGDTYNSGISNLGGGFPAYTGNFTLPDLVGGRLLMDIEQSYFGSLTDIRDNDADAGNLISPYIGQNTDNGVNAAWNNVYTDVVFTLNESTGYSGNIKGNTIVDGEGEKSIFVGGRKLGHTHIKSHGHSGIYETIAGGLGTSGLQLNQRPGLGVIPYDNITATFNYAAIDEATTVFGTRIDDGVVDSVRLGMEGFKKGSVQLDTAGNWGSFGNFSGFGGGEPGRTVMRVSGENPPINLSPQRVTQTSLALAVNFDYPVLGGTGANSVPFASGGGNTNVPAGFTNYYQDEPLAGNYGTLLSNPGSDFASGTGGGAQSFVTAHDHEPITVVYDQNSLKPQSTLVADVNIPATTNLDNASNVAALAISMNTSQPSMTCIYIIRAY